MNDIAIARASLSMLDLTSLNDGDTDDTMRALVATADTPFGRPAALCVYARGVPALREAMAQRGFEGVQVAAVANFPAGTGDAGAVADEAAEAVALGADEIDVVFPWRALIDGDAARGERLVLACKAALPTGVRLKVIVESGELKTDALIRRASDLALAAGADFIKTSTGKVKANATLPAAEVMLSAIRDCGRPRGSVGFKAAGGVRTVGDAASYLALADRLLGPGWATPATFRFGASGLLAALLTTLSGRGDAVGGAADY